MNNQQTTGRALGKGSCSLPQSSTLVTVNLCKKYEHNNSHLKFILDNTIFVWLSWFEINWLFCFCCFCVSKIYMQIGTKQELEKDDVKQFSIAPPTKWAMVHSSGCSLEISRFGQAWDHQKSILGMASRPSIILICFLYAEHRKYEWLITSHY